MTSLRTPCQVVTHVLCALLMAQTLPALAEIHQWQDAQGRVHFGDRPPENRDSEQLSIDIHTPARSDIIVFQHRGFTLSADGEALLREALPAIVSLYTGQLGLDVRNNVAVNLYLLDGKQAFDNWVASRIEDVNRPAASGIYISRTREVAVWNWSPNEEDILRTIMHESSHVILAQLSDYAPRWLHEGLAEYVEQMELTERGFDIHYNQQALDRLRHWIAEGELISLRHYLSLSEQQWQKLMHESSSIPYTVAWATVYFMLSRPTGKQTLRQILHRLEKNDEWPDAQLIDDIYPGGLTNMDYDFFRWAQQGETRPHSY